MKSFYELEVHFLDYDTIGVTANSEKEAHELAKTIYETTHQHIIGVTSIGTCRIDYEEVNNEYDEHTTEYMEFD